MADTIDLEANLASNSPTSKESNGPLSDHEKSNGDVSNGDASWRGRIDSLLAKVVGIFKSQPEVIPSEPHGRVVIDEIFRGIDSSPNGHPRLADFIGQDDSHLIFRRFGFLQARVLLHLQDQLNTYEYDLDLLDKDEESDEVSRNRWELLEKIQEKYEKYIVLMNHVSQLALRAQPPDTLYKSLKNFFTNYEPPIYRYHLHKDDLILLNPRGDTAEIDTRLTKFLLDAPNKLTEYLFTDREKSGRDEFMLVHNTRKILVAKAVLLGLPLILLLVGPIYPLYTLSRGEMTESTLVGIMFIQVGFTCVFACCLKYLTRPLRHELFACTVAYLGVLLVFMSQTIQGSH